MLGRSSFQSTGESRPSKYLGRKPISGLPTLKTAFLLFSGRLGVHGIALFFFTFLFPKHRVDLATASSTIGRKIKATTKNMGFHFYSIWWDKNPARSTHVYSTTGRSMKWLSSFFIDTRSSGVLVQLLDIRKSVVPYAGIIGSFSPG